MREGFSRYTSVRGPESHEGARESLYIRIAMYANKTHNDPLDNK
jgi:hypothetical protein